MTPRGRPLAPVVDDHYIHLQVPWLGSPRIGLTEELLGKESPQGGWLARGEKAQIRAQRRTPSPPLITASWPPRSAATLHRIATCTAEDSPPRSSLITHHDAGHPRHDCRQVPHDGPARPPRGLRRPARRAQRHRRRALQDQCRAADAHRRARLFPPRRRGRLAEAHRPSGEEHRARRAVGSNGRRPQRAPARAAQAGAHVDVSPHAHRQAPRRRAGFGAAGCAAGVQAAAQGLCLRRRRREPDKRPRRAQAGARTVPGPPQGLCQCVEWPLGLGFALMRPPLPVRLAARRRGAGAPLPRRGCDGHVAFLHGRGPQGGHGLLRRARAQARAGQGHCPLAGRGGRDEACARSPARRPPLRSCMMWIAARWMD
ncbi:hypothetical protein DFJ74DRAFT_497562 [Hyaloraphidium curvatum]|nr:hypothetical protein DFJ74DRAFT_497562 [Hyaloraphidium curvatum]